MGLIRGGLTFIIALALFFTLFAANLFLTISWSLDYNNVSPYIKNVSNEMATNSGDKGIVLQEYDTEKFSCQNGLNNSEKYVNFSFTNEQVGVPCNTVNEGGKAVVDYLVNQSVEKYYYQNYSCSLLDCVQNGEPLALVSQTAKEYWQQKFNSMILISLVAFVLLFLFSKKKYNAFILSGVLTIFSAIPFREITFILSYLPDLLPFKIIPVFFTESDSVFIIGIIAGIVIISIGIGLRFFKLGMKVNKFIHKLFKRKNKEEKLTKENIKEIVDEEIKSAVKKSKTKKKKK